MPKNRIIPTLGFALAIPLLALAQDPAEPPAAATQAQQAPASAEPATAAEKIIDEAIAKVRAIPSVSADLKVAADMLNQSFTLKGQYLKAPNHRLYLLLTLGGLGDATGTMLQVCDGKTLWDFSQVMGSKHCSKLNIVPIFKALDRPECDPKFREEIISGLGFAGPEALLNGLRKAFVFDQMSEDDLDGQSVWILRGTWRDGKIPVNPGGGTVSLGAPLPPYVPSLVNLYLGKDYWPYKVVFEGRIPTQIEQKKKTEEPQIDPTGRTVSRKLTASAGKPSKLILTYSNVKFDVKPSDETFAFAPEKGLNPEDMTDRMVAQLEQLITDQANKKRTDASKGGPVLMSPLTAPSPSAPAAGPSKLPGDAPK